MSRSERSSRAFDLAKEAAILLEANAASLPEDESVLHFAERYRTWRMERDRALREYLISNPSTFRLLLPYSKRTFQVASQILWYVDEVIVRDPLETLLPEQGEALERNRKVNLLRALRILLRFRQSIDSGYLLLGGSGVLPSQDDQSSPGLDELLRNPDLVAELDRAVRFGLERRADDQGRVWSLIQAELDTSLLYAWHIEHLRGTTTSPAIEVGERLPLSSAAEINSILKSDIYEQVRPLYRREVMRVLYTLTVSSLFDSAVLFDRYVDSLIASAASRQSLDHVRQMTTVGSLNLALPYVDKLPHDRLAELREKMPEAFSEFRARLASIVRVAMNEDPQHANDLARIAAERELTPMVRTLQSEMDAVTRKTRILGYGGPAVAMLGMLIGTAAGTEIQLMLPAILGGMATAVKAAADSESGRAKLMSNPYYFLWRAREGIGARS